MSTGPKWFRINLSNKKIQAITNEEIQGLRLNEINFTDLGLSERYDIQEWIASNPSILGDDLLIIGKEFDGFDRTNESVDIVAVDKAGKLVVIELKRDDSGRKVHGQAINYTSYFSDSNSEDIVNMLADHKLISTSDARAKLQEHINSNDLSTLSHDQRIILASHRFAPQVTSAVLWLNERATGENLITCVRLTPYQDEETEATDFLYLRSSTIVPGTVIDDYKIRICRDKVIAFLRKVGRLVPDSLPEKIRPDETAVRKWRDITYYQFWYSRQPWYRNNYQGPLYEVDLRGEQETDTWQANVLFRYPLDMKENFDDISVHDEQEVHQRRDFADIMVEVGTDTLNDHFGEEIAAMVRKFIEKITPIVDDLANESDGEA